LQYEGKSSQQNRRKKKDILWENQLSEGGVPFKKRTPGGGEHLENFWGWSHVTQNGMKEGFSEGRMSRGESIN